MLDGDTIRAEVDLGCDVRHNLTLRLAGINAPEMSTEDGESAKQFLLYLLEAAPRDVFERPVILVRTIKDRREKYGRYLAELLIDETTKTLNELMVEQGFAVRY